MNNYQKKLNRQGFSSSEGIREAVDHSDPEHSEEFYTGRRGEEVASKKFSSSFSSPLPLTVEDPPRKYPRPIILIHRHFQFTPEQRRISGDLPSETRTRSEEKNVTLNRSLSQRLKKEEKRYKEAIRLKYRLLRLFPERKDPLLNCGRVWETLEDVKTGEKKIVPLCCQKRDLCPLCGINYWQEKKQEALSLFRAVTEKYLTYSGGFMRSLNFEFTIPISSSDLLDGMEISWRRKFLNDLIHSAYRTVEAFLHVEKGQIGGVCVLHFWKSKKPVYPHYHLHITVSPWLKDGSLITELFKSKADLELLRKLWCQAVNQVFGIDFKVVDVKYRYAKREQQANHRLRYCFRSWLQDLAKWKGDLETHKEELKRALDRAEEMQGVKKIRWFGYLTPQKRREVGIGYLYLSEDTLCPRCYKVLKTISLLDTLWLNDFSGKAVCACGYVFDLDHIGRDKRWRLNGETFKLMKLQGDDVVFKSFQTEELVEFSREQISLFASPRKKRRFTYGYKVFSGG